MEAVLGAHYSHGIGIAAIITYSYSLTNNRFFSSGEGGGVHQPHTKQLPKQLADVRVPILQQPAPWFSFTFFFSALPLPMVEGGFLLSLSSLGLSSTEVEGIER
jgi:hypothetical protein